MADYIRRFAGLGKNKLLKVGNEFHLKLILMRNLK